MMADFLYSQAIQELELYTHTDSRQGIDFPLIIIRKIKPEAGLKLLVQVKLHTGGDTVADKETIVKYQGRLSDRVAKHIHYTGSPNFCGAIGIACNRSQVDIESLHDFPEWIIACFKPE